MMTANGVVLPEKTHMAGRGYIGNKYRFVQRSQGIKTGYGLASYQKEVGNMRTHTVKKPFMSRIGQFEPDIRSLCIGLDVSALKTTEKYACILGNNNTRKYVIETSKALELATNYKSFWKNKDGRQVAILPIKDFEVMEAEA